MRAFHNRAMIKQQIYENILVRKNGIGYSAVISFETSIISKKNEKALTKCNQLENRTPSNKNDAGAAPPSTYRLPQRMYLSGLICEREKNWPWEWDYLKLIQRIQETNHIQRNMENFQWQRWMGSMNNQVRWHQL